MSNRWKPHVTVAAVIEQHGRFLLVEEHTPEGLRLNNPAGHLDPAESPQEGVVREVLEETGCVFTLRSLVGVYLGRLQRPARATVSHRRAGRICGRSAVPGLAAAPLPPPDDPRSHAAGV
jgi:8-oxo-dGTP pyrophosphatase MutT (NUDIX family)